MRPFLVDWYAQPVFQSLEECFQGLDSLRAEREENDPAALAGVLERLSPGTCPSLWHRLGELEMPLLCLAGELDPKYCDLAAATAAGCRRGHVVVVRGAGHNIHRQSPGAYARAIAEFVEQVVGIRHGTD
jgi:2-succinyl-6-hydroxy-2,4-cyclohexadiene-1-carboxylate synthase